VETMNLLQSFGIDQNGRLVSVEEVARGKACDCCCPACGEILIARQGDVRAWHFAHASGNDCEGGAESALHKAAKQLIVSEAAVLVPGLDARELHQLDDGRCGEAALSRPAEVWQLTDPREEIPVGDYRIDVMATHQARPVFIEVAVTHLVDQLKRNALSDFGIHSFEIQLDPSRRESWTWDVLREEVLERPDNRRWLFHPDFEKLRDQARCEAAAKAYEQAALQPNSGERLRYRLFGTPIHIVDRGWGQCLWSAYSEQVNAIIKAIAKSLGGRYQPRYRNWVFPVGAKPVLIQQLEGVGAVRES
jgi:competence protein CoiA